MYLHHISMPIQRDIQFVAYIELNHLNKEQITTDFAFKQHPKTFVTGMSGRRPRRHYLSGPKYCCYEPRVLISSDTKNNLGVEYAALPTQCQKVASAISML